MADSKLSTTPICQTTAVKYHSSSVVQALKLQKSCSCIPPRCQKTLESMIVPKTLGIILNLGTTHSSCHIQSWYCSCVVAHIAVIFCWIFNREFLCILLALVHNWKLVIFTSMILHLDCIPGWQESQSPWTGLLSKWMAWNSFQAVMLSPLSPCPTLLALTVINVIYHKLQETSLRR